MNFSPSYAQFVLAQTEDRQKVADMADLLARNFTSVTDTIDTTPRVSPPAVWVKAKQKGGVQLAAWSVAHCDDPETLRAIHCTPKLRKAVRKALNGSTHLPDDLRREVAATVPSGSMAMAHLLEGAATQVILDDFLVAKNAVYLAREELERRLRDSCADFTSAQVLQMAQFMLSIGEPEHVIDLLAFDHPAAVAVQRALLDALFSTYDWGWLGSDALNVEAAVSYGLVPAGESLPLREAIPPGLATRLALQNLPLTTRELATVTALGISVVRKPADLIRTARSREQMQVILDLLAPGVDRMHEELYDTQTSLLTGNTDPLMDKLLVRLDWYSTSDLLVGSWFREVTPYNPRDRTRHVEKACVPPEVILPSKAQVDFLFSDPAHESDRTRLVSYATAAMYRHDLPEAYRRMLLETVPGLADHAVKSENTEASRWVWERLAGTTRHIDRALDQLAAHPEQSLSAICRVLGHLDAAAARRVTGPTALVA